MSATTMRLPSSGGTTFLSDVSGFKLMTDNEPPDFSPQKSESLKTFKFVLGVSGESEKEETQNKKEQNDTKTTALPDSPGLASTASTDLRTGPSSGGVSYASGVQSTLPGSTQIPTNKTIVVVPKHPESGQTREPPPSLSTNVSNTTRDTVSGIQQRQFSPQHYQQKGYQDQEYQLKQYQQQEYQQQEYPQQAYPQQKYKHQDYQDQVYRQQLQQKQQQYHQNEQQAMQYKQMQEYEQYYPQVNYGGLKCQPATQKQSPEQNSGKYWVSGDANKQDGSVVKPEPMGTVSETVKRKTHRTRSCWKRMTYSINNFFLRTWRGFVNCCCHDRTKRQHRTIVDNPTLEKSNVSNYSNNTSRVPGTSGLNYRSGYRGQQQQQQQQQENTGVQEYYETSQGRVQHGLVSAPLYAEHYFMEPIGAYNGKQYYTPNYTNTSRQQPKKNSCCIHNSNPSPF